MNTIDLERFIKAQESTYDQAFTEVKNGCKETHWMWYIYPQIKGLGHSSTSQYYGIENIEEAKAYLSNPLLGKRLCEISTVLLDIENKTAHQIFGSPDDKKLCSCMTLFMQISEKDSVFQKVLDKYYGGKICRRTIKILNEKYGYIHLGTSNINSYDTSFC